MITPKVTLSVAVMSLASFAATTRAQTRGTAPTTSPEVRTPTSGSGAVSTGGWTQPTLTGPDVAIGQVRLIGLGNASMTFPPPTPGQLIPPPTLPKGTPGTKGCWYVIAVEVRNVGKVAAQPFGVIVSSSLGEGGAMVKQAGWGLAPLPSGESYTAQDSLQLGVPGETVRIALKSSPPDPHPGDNQRAISVGVPACTPGTSSGQRVAGTPSNWSQPAGTPDLVISGLQVDGQSSGTINSGCSFPVRFLLSNIGGATVPTVQIQLKGGTALQLLQYINLKPGETREVKTTGHVHAPAGYYLHDYSVEADPNSAVSEIREDNNKQGLLLHSSFSCNS